MLHIVYELFSIRKKYCWIWFRETQKETDPDLEGCDSVCLFTEGEGSAEEAGGGGEEGEHAPQDGREEAALQQHDRDQGTASHPSS